MLLSGKEWDKIVGYINQSKIELVQAVENQRAEEDRNMADWEKRRDVEIAQVMGHKPPHRWSKGDLVMYLMAAEFGNE